MKSILESYLFLLESNNTLETFLQKFQQVISYHDPQEIEIGLLKYKVKPEKGIAFLFELPKEEVLHFHTVKMNFPIDIYFFNKEQKMISFYKSVQPNVSNISSKKPAKYAVEVPV